MATMHLGVLDVAYSDPDNKSLSTTGEVADFLEKQFDVMGTFYEVYGDKITDLLGKYTADRITAICRMVIAVRRALFWMRSAFA